VGVLASINNDAWNHVRDLGRIVWIGDFGTSEGCQSIARASWLGTPSSLATSCTTSWPSNRNSSLGVRDPDCLAA
jgi:hypothetical protein